MRRRDIRALREAKEALRQGIEDIGLDAQDQAEDDTDLDAAWFDQQWEPPWAQQQGQQR